MIEEAVGIRMYEAKRETCVKLVKKKEDKIAEFNSVSLSRLLCTSVHKLIFVTDN